MKFAELAEYFEKLEGTSSRLEMTRILAELFKKTTPAESRLVAYMTKGQLGPAYRSPDFGVADKMMLRIWGDEAAEMFKKMGDLGQVAEKLNENKRCDLTIEDVYKKLEKVAEANGQGSQEGKINIMRELISKLDAKGAKYAVKIVLGKLRMGFSDMTVLDALSFLITGDKKLRKPIEDLYNVRADLGEVVKLIKSEIQNPKFQKNPKSEIQKFKIDPVIGIPVLVARAERAKDTREIWERMDGRCAVEHKLDGLRIEAHIKKGEVVLFSRGLENVTSMYPDIVEGLKKQIKEECIVDGEMIALGKSGKYLPFQETAQRKRKYDIAAMTEKVPLSLFLFDVLYAKGKSTLSEPNEKRRIILEELVKTAGKQDTIRLIPRQTVQTAGEIQDLFNKALEAGTEGIVAKKLDGPYQAGSRDFNWIKFKKSYDKSQLPDTIDAVVMGYDAGQGKRSDFGIGDFLIGVYEKTKDEYLTIAKIGTGLTDEEWREMKTKCEKLAKKEKPDNFRVSKQMECDAWVSPKIVVEIMSDEITRSPMHTSGLALRFPRLVTFRDKKPEEATSLPEIQRMYKFAKRS